MEFSGNPDLSAYSVGVGGSAQVSSSGSVTPTLSTVVDEAAGSHPEPPGPAS